MTDPVNERKQWAEALRTWYFNDDPEQMMTFLRGRYNELSHQFWEVKRENITLWHENRMLREGQVPDSVSWIMMKIDAQRLEIRRLRQKLGYQDEASQTDGPGNQS